MFLAACDTSAPFPTAAQFSVDATTDVDVRFSPVDWAVGDRLVVDTGSVRLSSTARPDGHRIALEAPGRDVLRVEGLVDGQVVAATATQLESGTASGGMAANGPTSIHRATVCRGGTCSELIEYDYDLTAPDGNGTTLWSSPDGETAPVDRVRFVLAQAETGTRIDVSAPQELDLVP
jgi:hypothetical protein